VGRHRAGGEDAGLEGALQPAGDSCVPWCMAGPGTPLMTAICTFTRVGCLVGTIRCGGGWGGWLTSACCWVCGLCAGHVPGPVALGPQVPSGLRHQGARSQRPVGWRLPCSARAAPFGGACHVRAWADGDGLCTLESSWLLSSPVDGHVVLVAAGRWDGRAVTNDVVQAC
jgi:hypothetical protein